MDHVWEDGHDDRRAALEALIRRPSGRPGQARGSDPTRQSSRWLRVAAFGLWARALLRLLPLIFAGFYLSRGIAVAGRSSAFPDGAFFVWRCPPATPR